MVINVEEFLRDYRRMCNAQQSNCVGCALEDTSHQGGCYDITDLETIVPIVQKWVEEHPIKTYLME